MTDVIDPAINSLTGSCHCGRVTWKLDTLPQSVTACNCTICRRYGVLWAYGHITYDVHVSGETTPYRRDDGGAINFYFCARCGCVTHYIATTAGDDGKQWTAVNLRLAEPKVIADLPIDHFDGLESFEDLPRDHRCVSDMWF
ncbi:MAG: GFA family protein [bacterium]